MIDTTHPTAEIIPFHKQSKKERECSFCKLPESNVSSLFQGVIGDACICGDCVRKAKKLTEGKS